VSQCIAGTEAPARSVDAQLFLWCAAVCCSVLQYIAGTQAPARSHDTRLFCCCDAACYTWWRRPTGCFTLQVVFHKRATNYRALLWKMTYKDMAVYGSAPPRSVLRRFAVYTLQCISVCSRPCTLIMHNCFFRVSSQIHERYLGVSCQVHETPS